MIKEHVSAFVTRLLLVMFIVLTLFFVKSSNFDSGKDVFRLAFLVIMIVLNTYGLTVKDKPDE